MFEFAMCLIPLLPLLASVTIAAAGRRWFPEQCHWPCIGGAVLAFVFALIVFVGVALNAGEDMFLIGRQVHWISVGNLDANFSLRADGLTALMLVMVTFIGTLIAIYSAGYMHGDPGYPRFFAEVSLFLFFMAGLVLANNFLLLYACWEGVGLCSYLLIGFWFAKPSAASAARKAFLVTRLGDIGLLIGVLLLWHNYGHSLEYDQIFAEVQRQSAAGTLNESVLTWACVCLFMGAVGKSAQFPLHVWLPDAMEGPSPVSALIHAATMVTAGVYLVARCTPLFGLAPHAQLLVAAIGAFTALLAGAIAVTQTDLKRVLAYSTVSQLGFMFLALGSGVAAGEHKLAALAVTAAIFHLFTHAFFKALLFLSAGSVMHAMGDSSEMTRFSGLRKALPVTHRTFLCGALALSGFPLLSGFWSKDEILAVAHEASQFSPYRAAYSVLFYTTLFTAGLTAFYTFRAYFKTFWGEERFPPEAGHHPHDAPPMMAWPLRILAVGAVGAGFLMMPIAGLLDRAWILPQFAFLRPEEGHHPNWLMMLASSVIALAGIGIAFLMYVRQPDYADVLARRLSVLYAAARGKFYVDEIYELLVVKPMTIIAHVCRIVDAYLIDGVVDLVGQLPVFLGFWVRPIQNGLVQFYALLMALGLAGLLLSILLR